MFWANEYHQIGLHFWAILIGLAQTRIEKKTGSLCANCNAKKIKTNININSKSFLALGIERQFVSQRRVVDQPSTCDRFCVGLSNPPTKNTAPHIYIVIIYATQKSKKKKKKKNANPQRCSSFLSVSYHHQRSNKF